MSEECYVYVIAQQCNDPANDHVYLKVGISRDPRARLVQLQTSSPFPLMLQAAYRIGDRRSARQLEKFYHDVSIGARTHGEWFWATPAAEANDLAAYAVNMWDKIHTEKHVFALCERAGIPWSMPAYIYGHTNGVAP